MLHTQAPSTTSKQLIHLEFIELSRPSAVCKVCVHVQHLVQHLKRRQMSQNVVLEEIVFVLWESPGVALKVCLCFFQVGKLLINFKTLLQLCFYLKPFFINLKQKTLDLLYRVNHHTTAQLKTICSNRCKSISGILYDVQLCRPVQCNVLRLHTHLDKQNDCRT